MKFSHIAGGIALTLCLGPVLAQASDFPSKPIQIVVPYPPGGTADLLPRLVAERLPDILNVPVMVVNKPGAAGTIGADFVARSDPDGYTLLTVPPHFFVSDMLYKINFKPRDFTPVSILASYPNVLLANPEFPANNITELLELAKKKEQSIEAASAGTGTSQHLSAVMLEEMTGIKLLHVPYKGSAPALTDTIAGHVDIIFDNLITAIPYIESKRLKLLGVGTPKRNPRFPDTPAISEAVPGYESVTWMAITAPPKTPADVVEKLSNAIAQAMKDPKLHQRIEELQAQPEGTTAAAMAEVVRKDSERWAKVIKAAGVEAQ